MLARLLPARVSAGQLAGLIVATSMAMSSIVFSEPAIADALLMAMIFAVPTLGAVRFGRSPRPTSRSGSSSLPWVLAAAGMATTIDTAIKHQLITLFLAVSAVVLAGYITVDPRAARASRHAGVCGRLPRRHRRRPSPARSTFSLAPTTSSPTSAARAAPSRTRMSTAPRWLPPSSSRSGACCARTAGRAYLAAAVALVLTLGVLLSGSRGAWISLALSLALLGWITLVRSRRRTDFWRFGIVGALGSLALIVAIAGALQVDSVNDQISERASLDQGYDTGSDGPHRRPGQGHRPHAREPVRHRHLHLPRQLPPRRGAQRLSEPVPERRLARRHALHRLRRGNAPRSASAAPSATACCRGRSSSPRPPSPASPFEGLVVDTDHWRPLLHHHGLHLGSCRRRAAAARPLAPPRRLDAAGFVRA
ncbi:MAG: O-antigen ligase family protein [Hyphomicrobium sp.]